MCSMKQNFSEYRILVVGAGVMGRGIAQVMAAQGLTVYMTDLKQEYLDNALREIDRAIDILKDNGMADESSRETVRKNLHVMTNDGIPLRSSMRTRRPSGRSMPCSTRAAGRTASWPAILRVWIFSRCAMMSSAIRNGSSSPIGSIRPI